MPFAGFVNTDFAEVKNIQHNEQKHESVEV